MTSRPSVAVIGLGLMGRPMARTLIRAGIDVRGWNRSRQAVALTDGIPLAGSLADTAQAEICLMVLTDSAAVDAVLSHLEPHLRPDHLVLDMGSSDPRQSKAHAARLSARRIGWVDAPVSGGPEGAAAGTLAIMAGGAAQDVARARPVLESLGTVTHIGGPGAGHTVKAVNQLIVGLTIETVAEALMLAESCGIDPRLVQQALRGGFADSKILQIHGSRMIDRAYVPGARAAVQLKDLRLALSLAASAGVSLPHLAGVAGQFERLVAAGDGELDHSAVHKLLSSGAGA
jgi:3-hydroxyisobutyrate dehydrogenase-like beta-hydroxyacid dehydrogenase